MSIQQKTVFETSDGSQFASLHEAEQHEFVQLLGAAIETGCKDGDFDTDVAIDNLLANFTVTLK